MRLWPTQAGTPPAASPAAPTTTTTAAAPAVPPATQPKPVCRATIGASAMIAAYQRLDSSVSGGAPDSRRPSAGPGITSPGTPGRCLSCVSTGVPAVALPIAASYFVSDPANPVPLVQHTERRRGAGSGTGHDSFRCPGGHLAVAAAEYKAEPATRTWPISAR